MPILAEIADKMPTVESMWGIWVFIGCLAAGVTLGVSAMRWWTGAIVVILSGVFGVLAARPDGIMDELIVRELGEGYLLQQRVSGFVPFVLTLLTWMVKRRTQPTPIAP